MFHHIKAYYTGHGDEFAKIKCVLRCIAKGERRVKVGCRRPLKDNTRAWINIDGIITGEIVDSKPVALAVYSDISDLTRLKAERDQLLEEDPLF